MRNIENALSSTETELMQAQAEATEKRTAINEKWSDFSGTIEEKERDLRTLEVSLASTLVSIDRLNATLSTLQQKHTEMLAAKEFSGVRKVVDAFIGAAPEPSPSPSWIHSLTERLARTTGIIKDRQKELA